MIKKITYILLSLLCLLIACFSASYACTATRELTFLEFGLTMFCSVGGVIGNAIFICLFIVE